MYVGARLEKQEHNLIFHGEALKLIIRAVRWPTLCIRKINWAVIYRQTEG